MDSILTTIKKLLGLPEDQTHFDPDLITYINTVFSILNQLGIGPVEGFTISDSSATWHDFLGDDVHLEMVKTYMIMRVKVMFDTPSSSVLEATNRLIEETEFRMMAVMGDRR